MISMMCVDVVWLRMVPSTPPPSYLHIIPTNNPCPLEKPSQNLQKSGRFAWGGEVCHTGISGRISQRLESSVKNWNAALNTLRYVNTKGSGLMVFKKWQPIGLNNISDSSCQIQEKVQPKRPLLWEKPSVQIYNHLLTLLLTPFLINAFDWSSDSYTCLWRHPCFLNSLSDTPGFMMSWKSRPLLLIGPVVF